MPDREYRRLTRSKSRTTAGVVSTARSSLWLGKDHLLQIDATGYSESYKRFYFRDIQALVFCKTDTWLYQAVILAAAASLCALIAIVGGGPVMPWVFGIPGGLFALILLVHLSRGPSARAYLRTAVQTENLISLCRARRAVKVFDTLRPLIIAMQGSLPSAAAQPEDQPTTTVVSPSPTAGPEPVAETPTSVPPASSA